MPVNNRLQNCFVFLYNFYKIVFYSAELFEHLEKYEMSPRRRGWSAWQSLGSSCGRTDSVMDSHTTGPGFKTRLIGNFQPSF